MYPVVKCTQLTTPLRFKGLNVNKIYILLCFDKIQCHFCLFQSSHVQNLRRNGQIIVEL